MNADRPLRHDSGFSLIEIMIVVAIIGMLATLAIPSFMKSLRETRISRMANDLRIVYDAFNLYAMEFGDYPSGFVYMDNTPQPVAEFLSGTKWQLPTAMGGQWLYYGFGNNHLIVVDNFHINNIDAPMATLEDWQSVDERIDDGDVSSGLLQVVGGSQVQFSLTDSEAWN